MAESTHATRSRTRIVAEWRMIRTNYLDRVGVKVSQHLVAKVFALSGQQSLAIQYVSRTSLVRIRAFTSQSQPPSQTERP